MEATTEPKHGSGWRDAEWQSIEIFRISYAWGDEPSYVAIVQNGTKRPYQTANEIRHSWAKMLGAKVGELIVTAMDF